MSDEDIIGHGVTGVVVFAIGLVLMVVGGGALNRNYSKWIGWGLLAGGLGVAGWGVAIILEL